MYDETNRKERQKEEQEMMRLLEMLSQMPEASVPQEFDFRLRRSLRKEAMKRKAADWRRWAAAVACLLLGAFSAPLIWEGIDKSFDGGEIREEGHEPQMVRMLNADMDDSEAAKMELSRGNLASKSRQAFERDCEQALSLIVQGLAEGDDETLKAALNYKNDFNYNSESAHRTRKLYEDFFDESRELSYEKINLTDGSYSNVYRLSDGVRYLYVSVSKTSLGLWISDPVIEHGQWLCDQLDEKEFRLLDVISQPDGGSVEFQVAVNEEIRSFVWNEKEL